MAPKEKPNSLVAFLRAIRFKRKNRPTREGPDKPFAGLSSARGQQRASDEDDCVRSAN